MIGLTSLSIAAAVAAAPAQPAPALSLSAAAKQDVQCFVLYAIAVEHADEAKDDRIKQAGSLGLMYFYGKLRVEAPGVDLTAAVRQEGEAMESNSHVKDIGAACDSEFKKRGAELIALGHQLQQDAPPASPSS